eukprot:2482908-Amphidinium_carterae.1
MAAVEADGHALRHAAEELKRDREIVLAAVEKDVSALEHTAEALLLDSTFFPEAMGEPRCYLLKISMLSGLPPNPPLNPPKQLK